MITEQSQANATRQLVEMYERERAQLVRELQHDMAQRLTALKCHLEIIRRQGDSGIAKRATQIAELTDQVVQYVRDLSLRLRPPMLDDLGLKSTLIWYANQAEALSGKMVILRQQGLETRLDYLLETVAFRVIQEIVGQLLKDAGTTTVILHVAMGAESLSISVERERLNGGATGDDPTGELQVLVDRARTWTDWLEGTVSIGRIAATTDRLTLTFPLMQGPRRD